jgi:hypothetical protein
MFVVPPLFRQLCSCRSTICTRRMLVAKKITLLHFESHAIHWVANLEDEHFWPTLKRLRALQEDGHEKSGLFGNVLIPIFINNGRIPQDADFQEMLRSKNLDARKISDMLDHHYKAAMERASA